MTTIVKANVYTTTDGQPFTKFADAKKEQDIIDRRARLIGMGIDATTAADIADHGVEVLAALTLPSGRKPRKPQQAVLPE